MEHINRTELINAMVHLYRGQLGDATAWRSRIDATTNWAVVLSASALSFVFSDNSIEEMFADLKKHGFDLESG